MASCDLCKKTNNLFYWYIPDPYDGHPHWQLLICENCPKPNNPFFESKPYNVKSHAEELGFIKRDVNWVYVGGPSYENDRCANCDGIIGQGLRGYRRMGSKEEWYCKGCYEKNYVETPHKRDPRLALATAYRVSSL